MALGRQASAMRVNLSLVTKQRSLVADGDSSACEELVSVLPTWGYNVETADDGKQALDRALWLRGASCTRLIIVCGRHILDRP
jgi:PleD family two-component response regulator